MELDSYPNGFPVAEVELVYKSKVKASDRATIGSSKAAYQLFKEIWSEDTIELQEEFKVLFLNRANRVLAVCTVSSGGITGTVADPRIIFAAALKCAACALVLGHNHPSGQLKPSQQDEALTNSFKQAGQFLEIRILDHLIISNEGYYSFADEGAL